jgi:serine protease Do
VKHYSPSIHLAIAAAAICVVISPPRSAWADLPAVIETVQPKIVKIYGAGGLRGLEAYQSGWLISAQGHVLTVWSYVLDTDAITVTLDDGRKFNAEIIGHDPRLEIAVLKIDGQELPHFNMAQSVALDLGDRVLAFSNLYGVATGDEPASVLKGVVAAKTDLHARRGVFQTLYGGPIYVLDAMTNNPGAAGGALTDTHGRLAGFLGKELRSAQNNTWLNYAIPIRELTASVDNILAGRSQPLAADSVTKPAEPLALELLGMVLVPDVLDRTPPFVDEVLRGSPAEAAGVRPDDLVLFLGEHVVQSSTVLREQLGLIDRGEEITLTLQRGQELLEVHLRARP